MYGYILPDDYTFINYTFPLVDNCALKGYLATHKTGWFVEEDGTEYHASYECFVLENILTEYLNKKSNADKEKQITSASSNKELYVNYWIEDFVTRLANGDKESKISSHYFNSVAYINAKTFVWEFNISYKPDGRYNTASLTLDSLGAIEKLYNAFVQLLQEIANVKTTINFSKSLHQNLDLIQESGKLKIRFNIASKTFTFYKYFSVNDVKQIIEILGNIPKGIEELKSNYDKSETDFFDSYSELVEFVGRDYDSFIYKNKARFEQNEKEKEKDEIRLKEEEERNAIRQILVSIKDYKCYYKYVNVPVEVRSSVDSLLRNLDIDYNEIIFLRKIMPHGFLSFFGEPIFIIITLDGVYIIGTCIKPKFIKWVEVSSDKLRLYRNYDMGCESIMRLKRLMTSSSIEEIKNVIFG